MEEEQEKYNEDTICAREGCTNKANVHLVIDMKKEVWEHICAECWMEELLE